MKVLVTGGAGFIGSHLVDRLIADKHQVVILDHFTNGEKQHFKTAQHKKLLTLHQVDISDRQQLHPSFFNNIDWVFHLASYSKKGNEAEMGKLHKINVDGTVNMLEQARKAAIKKFIFTSTASVYGKTDKNPVNENTKLKLDDSYAFSKHLGELYTLHWGKVYKLRVVILRLFNVYGPKIRPFGGFGTTLSIFLSQKKENRPYQVRGDGYQKRDFTFVADVVDALIVAARSKITNEIINIATGVGYSLNTLLDLLGGEKHYLAKLNNEPDSLVADIKKAKKLLSWQPKITLSDGIAKVLQSM